VHSFIEPDLFENNVLIDNTIPIYLIFCDICCFRSASWCISSL